MSYVSELTSVPRVEGDDTVAFLEVLLKYERLLFDIQGRSSLVLFKLYFIASDLGHSPEKVGGPLLSTKMDLFGLKPEDCVGPSTASKSVVDELYFILVNTSLQLCRPRTVCP